MLRVIAGLGQAEMPGGAAEPAQFGDGDEMA